MPFPRRGSAKKKHEARLAWLSTRPDRYVLIPGIHDDVSDLGRLALDELRAEMVTLDLFGTSTEATQRETIRRLVSELRGERVVGGW